MLLCGFGSRTKATEWVSDFFDKPPDLPRNVTKLDKFRRSVAKGYRRPGAFGVEFDIVEIDGFPAVYQIVKHLKILLG